MKRLAQSRHAAFAALIAAGALSALLSLMANVRSAEAGDATLEYLRLQNDLGRAERAFLTDPTVAKENAVEMIAAGLPAVWAKIEKSGRGVSSLLSASILALLAAGFAEAWKETIRPNRRRVVSGVLAIFSGVTLVTAIALGAQGWFSA